MGYQIGFRYMGDYHSFVVLMLDQEEAIAAAMRQALVPASRRSWLYDLTVVNAANQIYKA